MDKTQRCDGEAVRQSTAEDGRMLKEYVRLKFDVNW